MFLPRTRDAGRYKAYRPEMWWWEIALSARKVFFAVAAITMRHSGVDIQINTGLLVVVLALAAQLHFKPYTADELDNLEALSLLTQFFTLVTGVYMFSEYVSYDARQAGNSLLTI